MFSIRSARPVGTRTSIALRAVALTILTAGCGGEVSEAQSTDGPDTSSADTPVADSGQPEMLDLTSAGFDEGSLETAALGIVEFADFGCVHCAEFHTGSYPTLHDEFVAAGDVLWKFIPIDVGGFPNGDMAGRAGICAADAGAFGPMRDRIFTDREDWLTATTSDAREHFVSYAASIGVGGAAFEACIDGQDAADRLEAFTELSRQVGVQGTPSFILQGQLVQGAPPLENFQDVLNQIIPEIRAESTAAPGANP